MNIRADSHEQFDATAACHADHTLSRETRRILILDDDLGFLLWLSQTLVEAGYAAFPAGSVENATALAKHLSDELEVLVVNPQIRQVQQFLRWLRSRHPRLKVIALLDSGGPTTLPAVDGSLQRECGNRPDMIRLLEHLLPAHSAEPLLTH